VLAGEGFPPPLIGLSVRKWYACTFEQAMANNEYHLVTDWRLEGTVNEVSAILSDAASLPRWWPSVYLTVNVLKPGREDGTQKVVKLHTRGWLPYTLDWTLRVTESRPPYGFSLEAEGDLKGRGVWTFVQDGSHVLIHYDWRIRADKVLLQTLSFAFKPILCRQSSLGHETWRRKSQA